MSCTSMPHNILTGSTTAIAAIMIGVTIASSAVAATPAEAARRLVQRLTPQCVDQFLFESIAKDHDRDVFELDNCDGKIAVRGSSGVAIASGWNWYLKYYCHCHVSLSGNQLKLPDPLPEVPQKVRRVSPFKYRYYLNYCAFSYSLAWYDWPQWERLIDWMALQGVNMPLSITGQEAIWYKVYRDLGLSDKQIADFFVGPAYLPFGWMGCIDGWGGPLPKSWIDSHAALQKKILARQRSLGMTPVLQGFTGHVPAALKDVLPKARLQPLTPWCGFPGTYFLDPQDPLFVRIGRMFIEEQTRQFGSDHLYASDTFIEMPPLRNDPPFLAAMGKGVYEAMRAGDPQAVWVMMGWIFFDQPQFWKPPQGRALLGAVPDDRMLLLDLWGEKSPVWQQTEAFYGKPWIWCIIQHFGDIVSLHGGLPQIAENLHKAISSVDRGKLVGMGIINEGLGYNPVVYDFMTEIAWSGEVPELNAWIHKHIVGRYGSCPPAADEAWRLLSATVYRTPAEAGSAICARPSWDRIAGGRAGTKPYDPRKLAAAWQSLLQCADQLGHVDAYRFDLVNVGRQSLSNLDIELRRRAADAYKRKDRRALAEAGRRFLDLVRDMDELAATRQELLLGRWLADAKRWATTDAERRLYEQNARALITLWGPRDNQTVHDYANKEWSGMLVGFYLPRWQRFFDALDAALAEDKSFDAKAFETAICDWEEQWTRQTEPYPTTASGDSIAVSRKLWDKYGKYLQTQ